MKRKIVLLVLAQMAVFLIGGLYVAFKTRATTRHVNDVVRMHQVEHLREHFLLQLKRVQSDLILEGTSRSRTRDVVGADLAAMESSIEQCFGCHHAEGSIRRVETLKAHTARYRQAFAVASAATVGSDARRSASESAFRIGEELIAEVGDVLAQTTRRLERHTLEAMGSVERANYVVYGLVVLGPLLSALFGLFWASRLTRPLDALMSAIRMVQAGDLDHRVEGLRDEFALLADSFNDMARSLKDQMQLMLRAEQLVVVGELAAGLVHEIKNPLAGIKVAVQVLSREAALSEEDRDVLVKVGREVVGLESLLKSFLEFARPPRPQLADVDVNAVITSVIAFYLQSHALEPGRPVRIATTLRDVPRARADAMQLKQILLNLLLNAVDAMPAGGSVEISTSCEDPARRITIAIADRGRGISREHAAHVFKPFFTTKPSGTGLGLAVSKRLVEQHGGSIGFSPNAGGGTIFRVEFPQPTQPRILARTA